MTHPTAYEMSSALDAAMRPIQQQPTMTPEEGHRLLCIANNTIIHTR